MGLTPSLNTSNPKELIFKLPKVHLIKLTCIPFVERQGNSCFKCMCCSSDSDVTRMMVMKAKQKSSPWIILSIEYWTVCAVLQRTLKEIQRVKITLVISLSADQNAEQKYLSVDCYGNKLKLK